MTRNNRSAISSRSLVVLWTALVVALWSGATWGQTANTAPEAGNRADGTVVARSDEEGDDFDARIAAGQTATRDDYGYAIVTADFDDDGFCDADEVAAGADPYDAASRPASGAPGCARQLGW